MPIIKVNAKGQLEYLPADGEAWKKSLRRVLKHGPPLSGKTTGLMTFPAVRHIMAFPGEIGYSSIQEDEFTKLYSFEVDPGTASKTLLATVKHVTNEILTGKHGEVTTFAIDGLHVFYHIILKSLGWPDNESLFGDKAYGKGYNYAQDIFENYLNPILTSPIPYVVATCYDGEEAIEKGGRNTSLWPALPGKMAKLIMGKFPVVIHTTRLGVGKSEQYFWELQAKDTLQGVGVHVPTKLRAQLPPHCKPDWMEFEKLLLKAAEPVPEKKLA